MLRGLDPRKWFVKAARVPVKAARQAAPAPASTPAAAPAGPVPAASNFGSAVGIGSPVVRRDLSDKRKRRRKKKRKRR
jgi:hypothetical protein